jgi:hypothetical protein
LTEPIDTCITPDYWVNQECIGSFRNDYYQKLTAQSGQEMERGKSPYTMECAAEKSLTAYFLQHPELLRPVSEWLH